MHWSLIVLTLLAQKPVEEIEIHPPFVSTPEQVVEAMLKLADVNKSDVVYDLGCGERRIGIAAAKMCGARAVGIDHNPERVETARANAREAGVDSLVRFETKDIFDADIRPASVVMLYLFPSTNAKLRPKLLKELKPGTRIVSHEFGIGDWKPEKTISVDGAQILLWTVPRPDP